MSTDSPFDVATKREYFALLLARLRTALEDVTLAQRRAQEGATHEENRSEGDKDMRATEVSYVARGQAARVVALEAELARVEALSPRAFDDETPLAAGALVRLRVDRAKESANENEHVTHHLLMPGGAGIELSLDARPLVTVIGTRSPLGQALVGAYVGDEASIDTPEHTRTWTIEAAY